MSKQNSITLGCDPEVFVRNSQGIVPICGLLGGTKAEPKQMAGMQKGFMYQEDGPAAELNIPICTDGVSFSRASKSALNFLVERLSEKNLSIDDSSYIELKDEWVKANPHLGQIGCDPDYCAYDTKVTPRGPLPEEHSKIRGAGGHIHVGYPTDMIPPEVLVQFLDLTVGLPTVFKDTQGARRRWWGKAGIYRPKEYGVEYRTLSNFWLLQQSYAQAIGMTIINLVDSIQNSMPEWVALYNVIPWKSVQVFIDTGNGKAATEQTIALRKQHKLLANLSLKSGL